MVFSDELVSVILPRTSDGTLELTILRRRSDWQLSSLAQICSLSIPQALLTVEHLYIQVRFPSHNWEDDIESRQWLELLHLFAAVKSLYIDDYFAPRIVPALQELVGERVIEVLPYLQNLFLNKTPQTRPVQEGVGQFIAARQLAGHSIAVSRWG